ncbi:hypothetical protein ACC754_37930, partial [Rhizobium johnstonii]
PLLSRLGDKHWSGQQQFPVRAVQLCMEAQNRSNLLFSCNCRRKSLRALPGIALGVEAEVDDVAVLDDVLLAFVARLAGILGADFAVVFDVVVIG